MVGIIGQMFGRSTFDGRGRLATRPKLSVRDRTVQHVGRVLGTAKPWCRQVGYFEGVGTAAAAAAAAAAVVRGWIIKRLRERITIRTRTKTSMGGHLWPPPCDRPVVVQWVGNGASWVVG